jgi:hypothetical protein
MTSTSIRNQIELCEWSFGLTLPPSELKEGSIYFKLIEEYLCLACMKGESKLGDVCYFYKYGLKNLK